jgi:hypothetical protein
VARYGRARCLGAGDYVRPRVGPCGLRPCVARCHVLRPCATCDVCPVGPVPAGTGPGCGVVVVVAHLLRWLVACGHD